MTSELKPLLAHYERAMVIAVARSLREVATSVTPTSDRERRDLHVVTSTADALMAFSKILWEPDNDHQL